MFIQDTSGNDKAGLSSAPKSGMAPAIGAPRRRARKAKPLPPALAGIRLDAKSPVPLYAQIREALRDRILTGGFRGGSPIPSENELVRTFAVSRITVRQALSDLQNEGLVFKIHGKGTFVSRAKAVQSLVRVEGFGEAMSGAGHETFSRLLGHRLLRAGRTLAARLAIADDAEAMEIRRLRYLDRNPVSLDVTYVPGAIGKRLVKEDLVHRDVFAILDNDYGIPLERAELKIDAMTADASLANLLETELGAVVVRIERVTFTTDDQPIDFEYLYYRGDSFQYFVTVGRRRDAHSPSSQGK
jgi:GntR family transcriptional regulator